jgi:hypothetical protein
MPTVDTIHGLRVVIYPNDHRPAHVHVIGNGCEAVFKLHGPNGSPELRENYGFTRRWLSKIKTALTDNQAHLCAAWSKIHGAD